MPASALGPIASALGFTQNQDYNGDGWGWSWSATLDQLRLAFGVQLILAALIVVAASAVALGVRRRAPWRGLNPPAAALGAGSLAVIAVCTLIPRHGPHVRAGHVQLVPFHTIGKALLLHSPSQVFVSIGGNVVLFAPLGFFAYLALGRWLGRCIAVGTGISIAVELLQLPMLSRATDIDDVLTNTLGAGLGALAGYGVLRISRAVRSRAPQARRETALSPTGRP